MTDVLTALDEARYSTRVLEHPFYVRWSAGELTQPELALYAGEYRHAVAALAETSAKAAAAAPGRMRDEFQHHAEEEAAHVGLWSRFAEAAGADPDARERPLSETQTCVSAWTSGSDFAEHLAVLYVLEAGQPEIARTKLDGLTAHYGFSADSRATEYFRLHETLDVEHARQARDVISAVAPRDGLDQRFSQRLAARAAAALRGNWTLLDGVEAHAQLGLA